MNYKGLAEKILAMPYEDQLQDVTLLDEHKDRFYSVGYSAVSKKDGQVVIVFNTNYD
jgi:hypothetical protein